MIDFIRAASPSYRYLPRSPPKVPFGLQPAFDTELLLPRS